MLQVKGFQINTSKVKGNFKSQQGGSSLHAPSLSFSQPVYQPPAQ